MPLCINYNWQYYIYNAHGDVIGLVSDAGAMENTYEYDAWGNITNEIENKILIIRLNMPVNTMMMN